MIACVYLGCCKWLVKIIEMLLVEGVSFLLVFIQILMLNVTLYETIIIVISNFKTLCPPHFGHFEVNKYQNVRPGRSRYRKF
jgi:hypothetical protein